MLSGDNGILQKATDAKTETNEASAKEQIQLQILGSFDGEASLNLTELKKNLQSIGATVDGNDFPVTVTFNGLNYTINDDGTIGEREWKIAWVYNGSNWSNPYFKDESLKNSFEFRYEDESGYEDMDSNYSLTSENEIVGQIIAKLYSNGELEIIGSGPIPEIEDNSGSNYAPAPWNGFFHYVSSWER